ncbi:MAG: hypothetical protein IJ306_09395, partial [Oscillospiraceae bacterium]|nr:hypothetical protein [Oscillospiraceae bacterium]
MFTGFAGIGFYTPKSIYFSVGNGLDRSDFKAFPLGKVDFAEGERRMRANPVPPAFIAQSNVGNVVLDVPQPKNAER